MPRACNLCRSELQDRLEAGDLRGLRDAAEANCETCGSRPRMRTLRWVLAEHVRHRTAAPREDLLAVQVGGSSLTRRALAEHFGRVLDATWGRQAELEAPAEGVHLVAGVLLAPDQDPRALVDAAAEALQVGGVLLLHVEPGRHVAGEGVALLEYMLGAGLQGGRLDYADPFTDVLTPWFLGRRLAVDDLPLPRGFVAQPATT